jgi:hypothetical protein
MPSRYGEDPVAITRRLVNEMTRLRAGRLEADYSGGNDEGGVQGIHLFGRDGNRIEGSYSWDSPIWALADELLSTKYGSWAGDWSAYGTLIVDAREHRAWTEGQLQVYEADEDPVNVSF